MDDVKKLHIGDIIDTLRDHPFVTVPEDMAVAEVAEIVRKQPDVRSIFVTDKNGGLKGALSLGKLIRTITASRAGRDFSTRRLIRCLACSSARDIMTPHLITASLNDPADQVVDRMLEGNIKEIPIVDDKGRIIRNAGLLDLWSRL